MNYLVWSIEHGAWWKANGNGYTVNRTEAGRYTLDEALDCVRSGTIDRDIPEDSIVPET